MSCVPPALASPTTTAWTVVHSGRCGVDCGETSTPLRMTRAMLPGKPYMASCVRHVQAIGGVAAAAALARERLCERDRCGRARVRVATTSRRAVCTRRWLESERRSRRAEANGEADACRVATEIYVAESRTQHAPRRSYIDDACFGARARGRRTEANGGPQQRARGQREDKYTLSRSWRSTLKRPCFQDRCADEKFEVAGKAAARR